MNTKIEDIGGGIRVCTSKEHTFGTDAFLLSYFATPKSGDIACDLGSGCGIIPLLWFRGGKGPANVTAVDIQAQAVEQMRTSAKLSGLEDRFLPVLGDIRGFRLSSPTQSGSLHTGPLKQSSDGCANLMAGGFDLVVCNPPYKATNSGILSQVESDRIARHETLCTIDDCCAAAARLLRFGGRFCLCQLTERLVDVLEAMRKNKIEPKRIRFVQKNKDGAPWLVLVEGKRGAKPFLKAEPTLMLYEDGITSREMRGIYEQFGKIIE